MVERDSARTEVIVSRDPFDYLAFVEPYHGGKRVDLGFSNEYDWDANTRQFVEVSWHDDPNALPGGAWTSYTWTTDHDRRMWAQRVDSTRGNGQAASVRLLNQATRALIKDLGSVQIPGTMAIPDSSAACTSTWPVDKSGMAREYVDPGDWSGTWQCMGKTLAGVWDSSPETSPPPGVPNETPVLATPAPQGDVVYVPVNIRHKAIGWEGGAFCDEGDVALSVDYIVRRCATKVLDVDSSLKAFVYRVDTTTGTWTTIPLRPGNVRELSNREINSLEVSEDGKEIMISTTRRVALTDHDGEQACHDETLEWISTEPASAGTVLKRVYLPQGAACGGWVEAGATGAPIRGVITGASIPAAASSGPSTRSRIQVPKRQLKHLKARGRTPIP